MKDTERKKIQNNNQTKQPVRTPRRGSKISEENGRKPVTKESQSKASRSNKKVSNNVVSGTSVGVEPSEVYQDVDIRYMDDANKDSDYESLKDSSSSQGDSLIADDEKQERDSELSRNLSKKGSNVKMSSPPAPKNPLKSNNVEVVKKDGTEKVHPSMEQENDEDVFEEASNGGKGGESDDETISTKDKVEVMEKRIEKLEEELREVAALEISLYSVIPEHGSSTHKVHTPARRLSRLYIHSCKHSTPSKKASIGRNMISGIILVTKTCGNDLTRLMFWLSNTVVLREIISQTFGISNLKLMNKATQSFDDWEETSTFTSALAKIESWIFSRVVESVWWQALTPNMLSPVEELIRQKSIGKLLGPSLGDQQQGAFAIELWKNAFQTAFQRLCPIRAAGNECGCLNVLSRKVMQQCIARIDVAMFNAILRESANQIPTDPVSDPIVDSRVLPIPAGEFSFGSGAQLKNAVGNWCRWIEDTLGVEIGRPSEDCDNESKTKYFRLLNELSDLLMLPKDLLMDNSIRDEVCPSINLDVIKRILCYFTPDEFCPDPVPGEVLESLNSESFEEQRSEGESFPYAASSVVYRPPSPEDVSEKVAEAGGKKGYASDDDLDDLDSTLSSLIEPASPCKSVNGVSNFKDKEAAGYGENARYGLLREVWLS